MDSSYLVESLSDGRLRVGDQPDLLFGSMLAIPALVAIGFFALKAVRARSGYPLIGALVCCVVVFLGFRVTMTSNLVLDRVANTAALHNTGFFGHDDFSLPLDSIDYAAVQSGSHDAHLELVLRTGDRITFGDADQKEGKGRAARAINAYIGSVKR